MTVKKLKLPSRFLSKPLYALVSISMLLIVASIFLHKSTPSFNSNPPSASKSVAQQPSTAKKWYLKKQTTAGTQVIFTLPGSIYNELIHWGDYLIYSAGDYSSNVQVESFNFKTGEKKTIYDQSSRNDFESGERNKNNRMVYNMQILDDKLYFSIGGYLTTVASFAVPLPPTTQVKKLGDLDSIYGKTLIKGHYFIVDSFGDSCWGSDSYSLVDFTAKKVTKIVDSVSGCHDGEEYVDIDKRDRVLLAYHAYPLGKEGDNPMYEYIVAVSLANPTMKEGVIAKQDMPADITSVRYLENSDQLLLEGSEKYLFDFSSNTINKTDLIVPTPTTTYTPDGELYLNKVKELNLPQGYEFVLE